MDGTITIPRKFKISTTTVELKKELTGKILKFSDDEKIFRDSSTNTKIVLEKPKGNIYEIKCKILKIYNKGIKNKNKLSPDELTVYHLVKSVKSDTYRDKVFIIGYKKNYITNINNIINKFRVSTDYIDIDRNIELYTEEEYEEIHNSIINKIKGKYHKFVVDLTNLYLQSDYANTKKLIEYLESISGEILFLLPKSSFSQDKFVKIFGDKYMNCTVEKHRFLYADDNLFTLSKVRDILKLSLKD